MAAKNGVVTSFDGSFASFLSLFAAMISVADLLRAHVGSVERAALSLFAPFEAACPSLLRNVADISVGANHPVFTAARFRDALVVSVGTARVFTSSQDTKGAVFRLGFTTMACILAGRRSTHKG